jgi:SpoVK/Ycf46/Vps4 family AAA+-type ATPase
MADRVISGQRTSAAVHKQATVVRRVKKSKVTSAAVLVLYGSTALRRRRSAETLAESLQVDLFRVDLSAVVSQYIGETEKNLNDVFDKAEASGAILFFDEADTLFGARGNVNDAHDRFANPETAHFLQRIESHDGIVILTTNGKQRIEQAFSPQTKVVVMVGTTGTRRMRKK